MGPDLEEVDATDCILAAEYMAHKSPDCSATNVLPRVPRDCFPDGTRVKQKYANSSEAARPDPAFTFWRGLY